MALRQCRLNHSRSVSFGAMMRPRCESESNKMNASPSGVVRHTVPQASTHTFAPSVRGALRRMRRIAVSRFFVPEQERFAHNEGVFVTRRRRFAHAEGIAWVWEGVMEKSRCFKKNACTSREPCTFHTTNVFFTRGRCFPHNEEVVTRKSKGSMGTTSFIRKTHATIAEPCPFSHNESIFHTTTAFFTRQRSYTDVGGRHGDAS